MGKTKLAKPRYAGHPYDSTFKLLMDERGAEIIPEFLPEASYQETLNVEVSRDPLRVDRVYKVIYQQQEHILHLEFETDADSNMDRRLLEYHSYFFRVHNLPVISLIVYAFPTTVVESPLEEKSGDEILLTFNYRTLCLWKLDAERYLREQIYCLYSLLPLMGSVSARLLLQALDEMSKYYKTSSRRLAGELLRFSLLLRRAERIAPEDKRQVEEKLSMWDHLMAQDPKIQQWRGQMLPFGALGSRLRSDRQTWGRDRYRCLGDSVYPAYPTSRGPSDPFSTHASLDSA
ncbi:MAG TPA: hypothetical protein VGD98_04225 [Ktedonobacteraceae bacterium]